MSQIATGYGKMLSDNDITEPVKTSENRQKAIDMTGSGPRPCGGLVCVADWATQGSSVVGAVGVAVRDVTGCAKPQGRGRHVK